MCPTSHGRSTCGDVPDEGVRAGRISMNRFVEITATAPAKIFGLYPKKGTIAVGVDADIVVWDPAREQVLGLDTLHMNVDYSPFEGRRVVGSPAQVLSRALRVSMVLIDPMAGVTIGAAEIDGPLSLAQAMALVDEALAFLTGRSAELMDAMARDMNAAAEALDYEKAARYRDRIRALASVLSVQGVNPQTFQEADVFAVSMEGGQSSKTTPPSRQSFRRRPPSPPTSVSRRITVAGKGAASGAACDQRRAVSCGSRSITTTLSPRRATPPASCIVRVDFPAPPFWDNTVTTLALATEPPFGNTVLFYADNSRIQAVP